jgi:dUTP pyrophosphatase
MIDTGAGVIDADYRGIVFVLLFNLSDKDFQGTPCCLCI